MDDYVYPNKKAKPIAGPVVKWYTLLSIPIPTSTSSKVAIYKN
jgi:hypothetical protein